ncbi:hypothetical protein HK405_005322 [Cladochytrium tenue]|nr:hypothetical protein HK405_005322 [Cladochytrium tenue]
MASINVPAVLDAGSGMGVGQSADLPSKLLDATRLNGELQTEIKQLKSELSSLKASNGELQNENKELKSGFSTLKASYYESVNALNDALKTPQSENANLLLRLQLAKQERDQAHETTKVYEEVTKRYDETVKRYEEAITSLKASREADKPVLRQIDKATTESVKKVDTVEVVEKTEKKALEVKEAIHVEVTEELDPELEALLQAEPVHGLTGSEVKTRLAKFGKNEIPENKTNPLLKFLSYFLGAISYLLEVACILVGASKDWIDFGILLFVLIINACVGYFEEARAESALAVKNTLAHKSRCWRNGKLVEVESNLLVPRDIIALRLGDIIPADCRLLGVSVTGEINEVALQIDESALTGVSFPVHKKKGSTVYSSSIVKQGQMLAVVTKTAVNTYIGRAAGLIATEEGHFQKVVNAIGNS